jgi:hypothetical protein
MDDERIDLSPLDPSRDEKRWQRLITGIAERAVAVRRRRVSVRYQLGAWARPALALAAAAAVVAVLGALLGGATLRGGAVATAHDPALTLVEWAATGERPETAALVAVLGGYHE